MQVKIFRWKAIGPLLLLLTILTVLVVCLILAGWTFGILTMVSGKLVAKRRARTFSIVIAALNCAIFPFGTTLGVFALVVLLRRTVRDIYAGHTAARPT